MPSNNPVEGRDPAIPGVTVTLPITLGQFLKTAGLVGTGGEAKHVIAEGMVLVNGEVDRRRGRKLAPDDVVAVETTAAQVLVVPAGGPGDTSARPPFE